MFEAGVDEVALVRTMTVLASLPIALRSIAVPLTEIHVVPSFRLYSIALDTPIILSVELLYAAEGAVARAGTVTVRTAEANAVSVALMRT